MPQQASPPAPAAEAPSGDADVADVPIRRNAELVYKVFSILALIVLILGILASLGALAASIMAPDMVSGGIVYGIFACIVGLIVTAIYWAAITLMSVVAGYIAQRAKE